MFEERPHLAGLLQTLRAADLSVREPAVGLCGMTLLGLPLTSARAAPFIFEDLGLPARRPVLLDLFCGEGGGAVGYYAAGFEVVGVDLKAQPRYPFHFIQADAIEFARRFARLFDAAHGSPPCQQFSRSRVLRGREHPRLIAATRQVLQGAGIPYVIENVEGARQELLGPVRLCADMWARRFYRHRLFESSARLLAPAHHEHDWPQAKLGRAAGEREMMQLVGHFPQVARARHQTEMSYASRDGIAQCIPPIFGDYVGRQLIGELIDAHAHDYARLEEARELALAV